MTETVQQLLRERAQEDTIGLKHGDRTWTWREHCAIASRQAAALIGLLDPARDAHVGTLLSNGVAMAEAVAAAGLGGYVLVGINNTRRGANLASDVVRAKCQILLVDAKHRPLLDGLEVELAGVRVIEVDEPEWEYLQSAAPDLEPLREVEALDTFMMIFTSGTSGEPKAVQIAQVFVLFAGMALRDRWGLGLGDTCYNAMPMFHSNGILVGWSVAATSGAAQAVAEFSASTFLDDIRRYDATYMNYVGKPLAYVLAQPERPDDADNPLKYAFGNEANERDVEEFERRFGCEVWETFGSTESAVIVTREPGTPKGSIGMPYEGVAIYNAATVTECPRAVFDDNGALVNADEAVGELVNINGAGYFAGYFNNEEANQERMRHGMYWSGDLAYRDADGWIYLAGRTSDWLRVDGENMAAGPIERLLLRNDAISQVAVYAVPDERVGDQVMAAVILRDGRSLDPAEWEAFLAAQPDLSPKAWPRFVRITPDLPTTATNKILKRELVAQGAVAGNGVLWERESRGTSYAVCEASGG